MRYLQRTLSNDCPPAQRWRMARRAALTITCVLLVTAHATTRSMAQPPPVVGPASPPEAAPPAAPDTGLAAFFERGQVFQDRNDDGVVDFVDARLVMGSAPGAGEVSAAADVAARLGFETSALMVPLGGQGRPIVIGAGGLSSAGLTGAQVGAAGLEAGEGLVAVADIGGARGVVITGGDEAGTLAAAEYFAGRLPRVWDPEGATVAEAAGQVRAHLTDQGVVVSGASVRAAHVRSGASRLERLIVVVRVASFADVGNARRVLSPRPPVRRAPATAAKPLVLANVGVVVVRLEAPGGPAAEVSVTMPPAAARSRPMPRRPGSVAKESLDLSNLYAVDGLLGDSDDNYIPDRIDALLVPSGDGTQGLSNVAARLGLESAGISIPIAVPASGVTEPAEEPTLVLVGTAHPLIAQLVKEKKMDTGGLQPGQGLISVVKKAFGEKPAVIVTGGDAGGLSRALAQVAERFPHIWARGKDRTTIDDVEEDVRTLLGGRSPAGQAATAIYKLETLAADLAGKDLESATVILSLDSPPDGLAEFVQKEAARTIKAGALDVTIDNRDVQKAKNIFTDEFDVASEVDAFWQVVRTKVVPAVRKKRPVTLEARLSEPPEVRARIEREVRTALLKAGASDEGTTVRVLSSYKQGYSWLYDVVRPALAGKAVEAITIRFAEIGPPPEWKQQAMFSPTRWLLELFPIDEILARDLKLDLKQIRFEKRPIGSPTYEVVVTGTGGAELLRQTFEPKYVLRPFFDRFADYEKVRVTTGWITASVEGRTAADERIVTDVERFWDHYQSKTLPALYDYIMAISGGKPRRENAPHFGELVVELSLSEPNYRLGLDNEQISSMEAMHEEIYFHTLHFVDVIGRNSRGEGLDYVGRVIPVMRPKQDGKAGHAKITLSGFAADQPAVIVRYKERGGREGLARLNIPKVILERPTALAAWVQDGRNGIDRLSLRVQVETEQDQRASLVERARAEQVDTRMMSAAQVKAIVDNLARLRAAGLYKEALAYHNLGSIDIVAAWQWEPNPKSERVVQLPPNGAPAAFPDITTLLPPGYRYEGGEIVQWNTPIPPPEAAELLAKMSTFKQATVYKVGHSYLGKDIWAMDLMPPIDGQASSHVSAAKLTTLKPTIVYSGRQDANEVSSTSHILKLAEMLLTDPDYQAKLKKVNVVIHPITNPDGAQLAYDLYKITPDFMLHAGYLGSLGVSLVSRWDSDPTYPESRVRPKLWRSWLPDIFLNPHGYPSHEWVQLFSEYAAWVRNRVSEARDWQQMRGWFIPGFNFLDDPKYPRNKEAAFKIREMIAANINAAPDVARFNARAYARYTRYGPQFDDENFKLDYTNGVLMYTAIKGARADLTTKATTGDDYMTRRPNVTIFFGSTEAPDETAYGDWMKLVATMGLQWDKANLEYLVQGTHVIERKGTQFFGGVSWSLSRPRPPKHEQETSD